MSNTILHVLTKIDRNILTDEAEKLASLYDWDSVVKAEKGAYTKVINLIEKYGKTMA